jgi:hypothetical protein
MVLSGLCVLWIKPAYCFLTKQPPPGLPPLSLTLLDGLPLARREAKVAPCKNSALACPSGRHPGAAHSKNIMDIERINAIGTNLADLTARTAALRGYL